MKIRNYYRLTDTIIYNNVRAREYSCFSDGSSVFGIRNKLLVGKREFLM